MPLNAKPFTLSEKITKRTFKGQPNIYADVDINQLTDIQVDAINRIAQRLGGLSASFQSSVVVNTLTATQTPGTPLYTLDYDVDFAGGGYLFAKNIRFDIPAFSLSGTLSETTLLNTTISFYLKAKKKTVTFADDNVMAGVDGGGLGGAVASSDADVYYDEEVVVTKGDTAPSLTGGFELIGKLASVTFQKKDWVGNNTDNIYEPVLVFDAPDISLLDIVPDSGVYNTSDSLFGVVARLKAWISKVATKLDFFKFTSPAANDVLVYDSGISKFKNSSIFSFIRSYRHVFTKIQHWAGDAAPADVYTVTPGELEIHVGDSANGVVVNLGGGSYDGWIINDIKYKEGATVSTMPTGTVLFIRFNFTTIPGVTEPPYLSNTGFRLTYNEYTAGVVHMRGPAVADNAVMPLTDGDEYIMYKKGSQWVILANEAELFRQIHALKTIVDTVADKASKTPTAWAGITFSGSWGNATSQTCSYRKNDMGFVTLKGRAKHAANSFTNVIGTVPAGFRPAQTVEFSTIYYPPSGADPEYTCTIQIDTSGSINIQKPTGATGSGGTGDYYFTLDGINYYID